MSKQSYAKNPQNADFSRWVDCVYNYSQTPIPFAKLTISHKEMFYALKNCTREEFGEIDKGNCGDILCKVQWMGPNMVKPYVDWFTKKHYLGNNFDQVAYAKKIVDDQCEKDGKKYHHKQESIDSTVSKILSNNGNNNTNKHIKQNRVKQSQAPVMYVKQSQLTADQKKNKKKQNRARLLAKRKETHYSIFSSGTLTQIQQNKKHQMVYVWILLFLVYHKKHMWRVNQPNARAIASIIFADKIKNSVRPDASEYPFMNQGEKFTTRNNIFNDIEVINYIQSIAPRSHFQQIFNYFNDTRDIQTVMDQLKNIDAKLFNNNKRTYSDIRNDYDFDDQQYDNRKKRRKVSVSTVNINHPEINCSLCNQMFTFQQFQTHINICMDRQNNKLQTNNDIEMNNNNIDVSNSNNSSDQSHETEMECQDVNDINIQNTTTENTMKTHPMNLSNKDANNDTLDLQSNSNVTNECDINMDKYKCYGLVLKCMKFTYGDKWEKYLDIFVDEEVDDKVFINIDKS
eukprot:240297_1